MDLGRPEEGGFSSVKLSIQTSPIALQSDITFTCRD